MKIALLVLATVLVAGCIGQTANIQTLTIETAMLPVAVQVEIADTESERMQGLMGRTSLGQSSGMLFLFDDGETIRNFWMKNTLISLDILFISADSRIVDIQTMVPCAAEPCPIYSSRASAAVALEVNAGFADANGINVGDKVNY